MLEHPQFKLLSSEEKGRIISLSENEYTVGRSDECSAHIPNDAVSSNHCRLQKNEFGDYVITDLNSTNGTVVNGRKVQNALLANGDIIRLGTVEILYESPNKPDNTETVNKTKVGIDLRTTAGTSTVSDAPNFSPFGAGQDRHGSGLVSKALGIGLAVLSVVLIVILVLLLIRK